MTFLHISIVPSLPCTQSQGITSVGCLKSTTVHCCFCLWLTLPEQTMSHPVQQKRVGGCLARSMSRHPALPTHSMGPDFTEGAEPGTGRCQWRSVQMCHSLYTKATLASSHFLCRGVISTLVCKTPPCSRLQPSQPASPCSILCPLKTAQNPVPRIPGSEALRPCKVQHLQIY